MRFLERRRGTCLVLALWAMLPALTGHAEERRWLDPANDLHNLPEEGGLLTWTGDDQIIAYRNIASLLSTRTIEAGPAPLELPTAPMNLADFRFELEGESHSLDDYLRDNEVAGLLILHNGKIRHEYYGFGNTPDSLWVTYSMAKSVVSMLTGAAVKDGYIRSLDDKVTDYLPQLKGSSYDQVSIRNVLQMASGVAWDETYADPQSDVANIPTDVIEMFRFLGKKERVAPPGEQFNYNTGETNLAGAVLRAAIGNNLATYASHKIWKPFGMEADANWLTHGEGSGERGGCCISATLRDYGRLGLFALREGTLPDGTRVLPDSWMDASTSPSKGSEGYGSLWWLDGDGSYRAVGIYGQTIYINPAKDLVIVHLGAWKTAVGEQYSARRAAFLEGLDALFE
ncbi:serine hydrolase domain-containing protein [Gilvimarinus sp. F26214L]|uniref:serine hydrolase domain-containing protein n=1 Tax=Gilvimarinus sp. DZF01 TaxID=3461371 RepID=UPI0040464FCC